MNEEDVIASGEVHVKELTVRDELKNLKIQLVETADRISLIIAEMDDTAKKL